MGDPKGFIKHTRKSNPLRPIADRIKDFNIMELDLDDADRRIQASRCMNCGIPLLSSRRLLRGQTGCQRLPKR